MSETPAHVTALFQRNADELSARVRDMMNRKPAARRVAERTADMITDQHGPMPGLGRALISAAYAIDVTTTYLAGQSGEDSGAFTGAIGLFASVGQILAEREAAS